MKSRWHYRLLAGVGALVVATLVVSQRATWLEFLGRFLDVGENPVAVDGVFVLGGGPDTRPFVAAALYNAGLTQRVYVPLCSVAPGAQDGVAFADHEVTRQVLIARGVPDKAIEMLAGQCASTKDEAQTLRRLLDAEPGLRIAVVTNDFHTRRTRIIFRDILGPRADRVHFFSAPTDGFHAGNWWHHDSGIRAYVSEVIKVPVYWLLY